MDNTLKRAILQFQANKEGCDSILCGYSFKNQSKAYRVNPDPTKARAVIPVHIHGMGLEKVSRSALWGVVEEYTLVCQRLFSDGTY